MEDFETYIDSTSCGLAIPADYSSMLTEDDGCLNFFDQPYPQMFQQQENNIQYPAPDDKDLADFFATDDFFGDQQYSANLASEQPEVTTPIVITINEPAASYDSGCSDIQTDSSSEFVDSSIAASPMSSIDSDDTSGSITNIERCRDVKAKKRLQNREAAKRYRMKKRTCNSAVIEEERELENENTKLRQEVDRLDAKIAVVKEVLRHQYGFPEDADIVLMQVS